MENPNNTAVHGNAGGATKIKPTSKEGDSYAGTEGYGFMTNDADKKISGTASNPHPLPGASPTPIMTHGDPNGTAGHI